jgi:hypothetical protein
MQVFRPTYHDETTSNITADIIEAIDKVTVHSEDSEFIVGAYESSDDQSAIIIAKGGRRFRVQLWEIL